MLTYFWGLYQYLACAPALHKEWDWDDYPLLIGAAEAEVVVDEENGIFSRIVDATDYERWVYLDLETNELPTVGNPLTSTDWDIGLQRYKMKLNSGIHGVSDVEVAIIENADYDSYTMAPTAGYVIDQEDDDDDGVPEYATESWFDYDQDDHTLTPSDLFYVIKNRNDSYFKFQHLNYYDDVGTSAVVHIRWALIDPPE